MLTNMFDFQEIYEHVPKDFICMENTGTIKLKKLSGKQIHSSVTDSFV